MWVSIQITIYFKRCFSGEDLEIHQSIGIRMKDDVGVLEQCPLPLGGNTGGGLREEMGWEGKGSGFIKTQYMHI